MATVAQIKISLNPPITVTDFDDHLTDLMNAAELDLGIAGVVLPAELDALCDRAIITYVAFQWETEHGNLERAARFKASYDEQKAQLSMATGYTEWSAE